VTCEVKSCPQCTYRTGRHGGWALQCLLSIKSIHRISKVRSRREASSVEKK
jgi:hypothetical protein